MPVHIATTAATSSSVTIGRSSLRFAGCGCAPSAAATGAVAAPAASLAPAVAALALAPRLRDAASIIAGSAGTEGSVRGASAAGVGVDRSALGAVTPLRLARQARSSSKILPFKPSSWLRSEPARSNAPAAAASCWSRSRASASRRAARSSGGGDAWRNMTRLDASSITSIALSGSCRSLMYRTERSTAARSASSVMRTL